MANVTPDDVRSLAQLARLDPSQEDANRLHQQFENIIGYLDQLQAVDVTGVAEYMSQEKPNSSLRNDEATGVLEIDSALDPVPKSRDDQVEVPKFM